MFQMGKTYLLRSPVEGKRILQGRWVRDHVAGRHGIKPAFPSSGWVPWPCGGGAKSLVTSIVKLC